MLEFIRSRAQSWVATVIIILIIIPFALWGINEYFTGGAEVKIASVNDKKIDARAFQISYQGQRQRMQEMLGKNFDPGRFDAQIKQDVLEGLIDQEVLVQAAEEAGYRVGDQELAMFVQSMTEFQQDGKFSSKRYEQTLRMQGDAPAGFEARLRRTALANQLYAGLSETAIVSNTEVAALARLRGQQRDFSHLNLALAHFSRGVEVTQAQIDQHYQQNSTTYQVPEQVSVDYLELDAKHLATNVQPDEQALRQLYEEQVASFVEGEERRARHILISVAENAKEDAVKAARAKAEDVLKRIRAGESFEKLAKEHSEDPGSKGQGGDLGFFGVGMMDPAFEKAAFALKPGAVSDIVRTAFGFHIIRVEEVKAGQRRGFDEVKAQLAQQYRDQEAERAFFEKSEKLVTLAYEKSDSLTAASEGVGLPIQHSALFSRDGGSGIAAHPAVVAAAFSDEVLKQGMNSEPVEVGEGHVVVLRLKDRQPATLRPLDEMRGQIVADLTRQAAEQKARAAAETLVRRLQSGEAPDAVAKEYGVEWHNAGLVKRDAQLDQALVSTAFRLPRPAPGKASYASVALAGGDLAVVRLSSVQDGVLAPEDAAQRAALAKSLATLSGNAEYADVLASLKKKAKIERSLDKL